jgi:hypothetical protein
MSNLCLWYMCSFRSPIKSWALRPPVCIKLYYQTHLHLLHPLYFGSKLTIDFLLCRGSLCRSRHWQVCGFLRIFWFPPPIENCRHDITQVLLITNLLCMGRFWNKLHHSYAHGYNIGKPKYLENLHKRST